MRGGTGATLCIIAGGRASRLGGVPKGLLHVDGRTVLDRLLALRPLFDDALLVVNPPDPYQAFEVRRVADRIPARGAPGGVHAALASATTPWVLAVACDMPFVTEPVVRALLDARPTLSRGGCFEAGGRLQPLLGVYRTELAALWQTELESQPSFRDLYRALGLTVLPAETLAAADPSLRSIESLNTPADLIRWNAERPADSVS